MTSEFMYRFHAARQHSTQDGEYREDDQEVFKRIPKHFANVGIKFF